jgi:hypothetical protein
LQPLIKKPCSGRPRQFLAGTLAAGFLLCSIISCTLARPSAIDGQRLQETVALVDEVKAFEETLGIEPTQTLSNSSGPKSPLSMLWVWLQRAGTIALRGPIDIRMAIGFYADKERIPLERIYKVEGYSLYYRQGNEFADERAVTTAGFAAEGAVRRVKVVIHEDLHADRNFDLPWEVEEGVVTPLGSLAAVEFFRHKGDEENVKRARAALEEERAVSLELAAIVEAAAKLFGVEPLQEAKKKVLSMLSEYPVYQRQFQRQTAGQNSATVVEAKLSHDWVYYRYFDAIIALAEESGDLKGLIEQLKALPPNASVEDGENYVRQLALRYRTAQQETIRLFSGADKSIPVRSPSARTGRNHFADPPRIR